MLTKNHKIIGPFGWYGMGAIVLAYALNNFSLINVNGFWYPFLNISGSLGIIFDSLYHKAYQSAVLNIIWILVAVAAVFQTIIK